MKEETFLKMLMEKGVIMKKLIIILAILSLFLTCEMDKSTYIIVYNANGGNGGMKNSAHVYGTAKKLNKNTFTRDDYLFLGWSETPQGNVKYTDQQSVNNLTNDNGARITLYAVWHPTVIPGLNLAEKLAWLQRNRISGIDYTIRVNANEIISPTILSGKNIGITLKSTGAICTIGLSSDGPLFTLYDGVTLTLDKNITLQGRNNNNASLVQVCEGGTLIMNTGSRIIGNSIPYDDNYSPFPGGGVYVGGTFTMYGGEISDNSASSGGGVYVYGTFIMYGGEISDNIVYGTITDSSGGSYPTYGIGGGVYVSHHDGIFIMTGGKISGNTSYANSGGGGRGGGVAVDGTFTMTGGKISGNTASGGDGYPARNSYGGGVYVGAIRNGSTFTMTNGKISGNTVYSNNYGYGGGVYVARGIFTKTGGTIYGYNENDTVNSNKVMSPSWVSTAGNAVYARWNSVKSKETTAGPGVNLSWDFNDHSPVWSGDWDY